MLCMFASTVLASPIQHDARAVAAHAPAKAGAATGAHCKTKRGAGVVAAALKNIGPSIGAGMSGEVFSVKGQPGVLLKRVAAGPAAEKEVRNLKIVGQLVGWGIETGGKKNAYILMKHMGKPLPDSPASSKLAQQAALEYETKYGIEHKDTNSRNTAMDSHGKPQTIDWGRATWVSAKSGFKTAAEFDKYANNPAPEKLGGLLDKFGCVVM